MSSVTRAFLVFDLKMFYFHWKEMAENESEPEETTTREGEEKKKKSSDEENKTNPGMELTSS